ncbi:FMN-binding protein [Photobacterium sagamiensis]|uniref:FMN-binding protein n=1 Tax=Photobacterium sagamiensis TaxID=2910241 RepID=UPI003D0BED4A
MRKKSRKQSKPFIEKIASVASILLLISAWYLGGLRIADNQSIMLNQMLDKGSVLHTTDSGLYQVYSKLDPESYQWVNVGTGIGYGGEMKLTVTVEPNGDIQRVAILSAKDTSSYLDKVVDGKLFDAMLGKNIKTSLVVDGISGATLSSNGLIQAVDNAADPIRKELFGYTLSEPDSALDHLSWLDIAAVLIFAAAVWVSKSRHPRKNALNWTVLVTSMILFGFYSASLFSSSTMGIMVSGSWLSGLGNYTALILLLLTVGYILAFNKNIYCQSICPFGASQQCLGKITNAKAVNLKHRFFIWFPRAILLSTLCFGVYFRNPAFFSYEPFGIMFGMVGSMYLFTLTFMIVLTSLVVHRPWCKSLCPINAMTDFLKFNKNWAKQVINDLKKTSAKRGKSRSNKNADAGFATSKGVVEHRSNAS